MIRLPPKLYSSSFYRKQRTGSLSSAEIVLSHVFDLIQPNSILDFGCGVGTWLAAARKLGAQRVIGYEGDWVRPHMLVDDSILLRNIDLESNQSVDERVDLAICLEVAEHLTEKAGLRLVQSLCECSDVVLFGAAIPGQGGRHHINEQWQSYWIAAFAANSFEAYDIVRPQFWNDTRVDLWYAQNPLLYIKRQVRHLLDRLEDHRVVIADLVHPRLLQKKMNNPSIKDQMTVLSKFPRSIFKALQHFM
jgi:hypothetical protein